RGVTAGAVHALAHVLEALAGGAVAGLGRGDADARAITVIPVGAAVAVVAPLGGGLGGVGALAVLTAGPLRLKTLARRGVALLAHRTRLTLAAGSAGALVTLVAGGTGRIASAAARPL